MLRLLRPLAVLDVVAPTVVTVGSVAVIALLGAIDHALGARAGLSAFYLVPVVAAAWSAGRAGGLVAGAAASGAWLLADYRAAHSMGLAELATRNLGSHTIICLGVALVVSALRRSIDALEAAFARERRMARHDPLTGLVNGRVFREVLAVEVARLVRTGEPLTLAYLDADGFKAVNDSQGHREGDRVLCAVATTLLRVQRRTDTVARLGGDEFAILMPATSRDDATVVLAKVRAALEAAMAQGGWRVSFSAGAVVAMGPEALLDPPAVETLIAEADAAMFAAKRRGGPGAEVRLHVPLAQGDLFARG